MTRAECCATHLHKHFAGCMLAKKLKLHEDTRWQIAGEAIEELPRYGGWKELDEDCLIGAHARGLVHWKALNER